MAKTVIEYHFVWCTLQRQPLITPDIERAVYRCIVQQALRLKCTVLALAGMPDHVHLVVRAPATLSPMQIAKQIKGVISTFVRNQLRPEALFGWRDSYYAHSLCEPVTTQVIAYVKAQKQHHTTGKLWPSLEIPDTATEDAKDENSATQDATN